MSDWTPKYDDRFGAVSDLANEASCKCHDPQPRDTGWFPGEEGPCHHNNCTETPWCGDKENTMKTIECDWCNRHLPKSQITEVGPTYTEANGEEHYVPVLTMCIDRDDCEQIMAMNRQEQEPVRPPNDTDVPF